MAAKLKFIDVDLAEGGGYRVPWWDVTSPEAGPRVLLTAALHGNELQGSEILLRLLPMIEKDIARGACRLVPFANPEAVRRRQPHIDFEFGRYYGDDSENNVNVTWPGNPRGSNAQRLSHALFKSVVENSDCLIDLHCWHRMRAATGLARGSRPDSIALVNASGAPFGRHGEWRPEITARPVTPCTLTSYFHDTDRTAMCVEFSGQYGFMPDQIDLGKRMVTNALQHLGVLTGAPETPARPTVWLNDSEEITVSAPCSGVFVAAPLQIGDWVESGTRLGHVLSVEDLHHEDVCAPESGYLFRLGPAQGSGMEHTRPFNHPYVDETQELGTLVSPERFASHQVQL